MKTFRNGFINLMLLAVATAAMCAQGALVEKMLPEKNDVKSFAIVKNSLQYAKGDDLTNIYNGGYELYTDNGVLDAARQLYSRGDEYVEVTIHTMKSEKAATDFLKYWQKQNKVKSLEKSKGCIGFVVTKPSVMSYSVVGKYFTTVTAMYSGSKATNDVKTFRDEIVKEIYKQTKSKK